MAQAGEGSAGWHYRADIAGLRAVAILPILLLHCGLDRLRGGFVGVDIFFVISGFLITAIMRRDLARDRFSILRFYRHRIVRILPALLVMIVIVGAIGCRILLPNQLRDLGWSIAATAGFVSNIYFYGTADYFAAASDAKPLIHTWSLAVEEQFYILYPLLLWRLRRWSRPALVRVIGAIALMSFAIGGWMALERPAAGFFLLPARIWELSLGALVALGAAPPVASQRARTLLALGALGAILIACILLNPGWPFPVPLALIPTIAAAVLIAYGADTPVGRALAAAPLRAIGTISYSAYLWHRPIIAFYQARHGTVPTLAETLLLLTASLAAGWASYRLVERPAIRRWRDGSGWRVHGVAVLALAGTVAGGMAIAAYAPALRPLPPPLARIAGYADWDATLGGRRQFAADRCFWVPTGPPFDPGCLRLSDGRPNVLLMGDSHGAHFSQALRELLPGANVLQATAATCRPLLHGRGNAGCRAVVAQGLGVAVGGRIDRVILSARWLASEQDALVETIRDLRRHGVSVLVIGPSVEYDADLPVMLVRGAEAGDPARAGRFRVAERAALDRAMAPVIRAAGADYASAIAIECPGGRCMVVTGDGIPMHFDHSHFTPAGARRILAPIVARHAPAWM